MNASAYQGFNWLALIWPILLIIFIVWFFRVYKADISPSRKNRKMRKRLPKALRPSLSFIEPPGQMSKRDWFIATVITVACGILSFISAGATTAPQTFWRSTEENPSITIDLEEEVILDNLLYYTGLEYRSENDWALELSTDGHIWHKQPSMSHRFYDVFSWKIPLLEENLFVPVRYIRITDTDVWKELGELVLLVRDGQGNRARFETIRLAERYPEYAALFDEQSLMPSLPDQSNKEMFGSISNMGRVPGRIHDQRGGPIFDEVYHARAAYEYIRSIEPAELTHPPLGKIIIALGIKIFGMTPFGWRSMGILSGILMIPLLYVLTKNLFDSTSVAAFGTALYTFENLRFTQTRLATIDSFLVLFVLLMYLFMYRFISSGYEAPLKKSLLPLFLCGLSFGMGAAVKWTAFYAALGLIVLYTLYLVKRGQHQISAGHGAQYCAYLFRTLTVSVAFFVVMPFIIYTLSYIPIAAINHQPVTVSNLLRVMWDNQSHMFAHHSDPTRDSAHLYSSVWWMWLLDIRPMYYYAAINDSSRAFVGALTNPLVTVGGLAAMLFAALDALKKKIRQPFFVVVGYLSQLVPWLLVSRSTFVYHYFPSVIFLTLALCYVFNNILIHNPEQRKRIYLFTGISAGLFFMLLPISAGLTIPDWYSAWFARWLPSWPF